MTVIVLDLFFEMCMESIMILRSVLGMTTRYTFPARSRLGFKSVDNSDATDHMYLSVRPGSIELCMVTANRTDLFSEQWLASKSGRYIWQVLFRSYVPMEP